MKKAEDARRRFLLGSFTLRQILHLSCPPQMWTVLWWKIFRCCG